MAEVGRAVGDLIVEFQHVGKSFNGRTIVKDISFSLHAGEIFGLIGPSGCGKTTILRSLIGFYPLDEGRVLFAGRPIADVEDLTTQIGFSTQDECFYDDLTCEENMRYFASVYGIDDGSIEQRITALLEMVELTKARAELAKCLSGGMRRRLDLAIALLHNPRVLILDEPTNGLDPVLRKHMLTLVERISKAGIAVIITSHLLEDLEHLCDTVAILIGGTFVVQGSPTEIRERHFPYNEIHLVAYPGDYPRILQAAGRAGAQILSAQIEPHEARVCTTRTEETVYAILRVLPSLGEHLIDLDVNQPTLNTVFETLVQRPQPAPQPAPPAEEPHAP